MPIIQNQVDSEQVPKSFFFPNAVHDDDDDYKHFSPFFCITMRHIATYNVSYFFPLQRGGGGRNWAALAAITFKAKCLKIMAGYHLKFLRQKNKMIVAKLNLTSQSEKILQDSKSRHWSWRRCHKQTLEQRGSFTLKKVQSCALFQRSLL